MARCEQCGNNYHGSFEVLMPGAESHTFDCFECAIASLAPTCGHCGCKIIGHGVEKESSYYCSEHCAEVALHGEQAS